MVLFELTLTRIITVYVAQGILCAFFLFLAYKILKRDTKRLNVIFSMFYIFPSIGLIVNFIYAPLTDELAVVILNFITNFFIYYALIFLLVFELILLKSEKIINTTKQLIIFIAYGIALLGMVIFYFIPGAGVILNSANNFTPVWNLPFFIYLVIVVLSFGTIPTLFYAIKISKKFEDETLKKKWNYFIVGVCALYIFMYGIYVSNYLNNDTFRLIMGVLGLILAIIGGALIYIGVGRQLER